MSLDMNLSRAKVEDIMIAITEDISDGEICKNEKKVCSVSKRGFNSGSGSVDVACWLWIVSVLFKRTTGKYYIYHW